LAAEACREVHKCLINYNDGWGSKDMQAGFYQVNTWLTSERISTHGMALGSWTKTYTTSI
jgi:hypothetical protein